MAAVIHQPSYEIFHMFDDILLLGKGGRTVYYGPEADVCGYFEGLGYRLPAKVHNGTSDCVATYLGPSNSTVLNAVSLVD